VLTIAVLTAAFVLIPALKLYLSYFKGASAESIKRFLTKP